MVSDSFPDRGEGIHPCPFFTYTKVFREQVAYYMAIGMSWDEYWNGDCVLPRYYRKAHDLKRKEENEKLWLQGRYIYDAIAALSPILKVNFSKKEVKAEPYNAEPYPITNEEYRIQTERQEQIKMETIRAKTAEWAKRVNAGMSKGDESGGRTD